MSENNQNPYGQPFGQQPPAAVETKPKKPWFKKKRVIIPAGILALIIGISNCGGGGEDPAGTSETSQSEETTAAAEETTAAEEAPAEETTVAEEPPAEEPPAEAEGTTSQQNALRSAENYISFSGFSRQGLIQQLEFEQYSTEDATWAVDNLEVDWNQEAAEKAQEYLNTQGFSRQGLIDQLIFEGFTPEEAEFGVTEAGL